MGRALVTAMKACHPQADFYLYTPSQTRAFELAQKINGNVVTKVDEMPRDLSWYLLAFKPQSLADFDFDFAPDSKVVSVLAGVKSSLLMSKFNLSKVARLMPNTPSAIGLGANLLYLNEFFDLVEQNELESLLSSTGTLFKMKSEADLDIATAFSGSGPALIFELARIFEMELNRMTEGRLPSKEIISRTFLGSATLMSVEQNMNVSFEELREQVTSKKGVTYEALEVLKDSGLQDIFKKAFEAAYKRTLELSK